MDAKALIDHYAAYDLWANTRIVDRLQREPARVLDQHVKSSFPSIRSTLLHIRDAECLWQLRLAGLSLRWPAEEGTDIGTVIKYSTALHDFVRTLTTDGLERMVHSKTRAGQPFSGPLWTFVMHTINHSTHHRGQVVTMMRQLDLEDVPDTDLFAYDLLRERHPR